MKWGNLKVWTGGLLLIGVLIRLHPYFYNRALEHDEAFVSNNIIQKSFMDLTGILDYAQAAPIPFLWIEKFAVNLLGNNELALRLFPLICGILSIFLFYKLANKILEGPYLLLAMGFFIFCSQHIHYTNDVKQYSGDVLFAIVILLLSVDLFSSKISSKLLIRYGVGGAICVWFSQPSIFVLAGSFIALFIHFWRNDQRQHIKNLDLAGLTWGISFLIYYFSFLRHSVGNNQLQEFHQPYYMPLRFWELDNLIWYKNAYFDLFGNPVGIHFNYLAGIVCLFGLYAGFKHFYKKSAEKKNVILLFLLPVLMAFGASALQKYSTIPRLMLFSVPMLILMLVTGLKQINDVITGLFPKPQVAYLAPILGGVLLLQPFLNTIHQTAAPKQVEEIKAPFEFIVENKQQGDVLYVYPFAIAQFDFYKNKYDLNGLDIVIGVSSYEDWQQDILKLKGKRVWFLLSHYNRMEGTNDNVEYPRYLNSTGTQKQQLKAYGSAVYLYEIR